MNEDLKALEMLEKAIAKSTGGYDALRKRADDVYDGRVKAIAKERGCGMATAHGLAAQDEIAKRAYAVSVELAERQRRAVAGGHMAAAYFDR